MAASSFTTPESFTHYADAIEQDLKKIPSHIPEWASHLRTNAAKILKSKGFPTRKNESWKYTPVQPILEKKFVLSHQVAQVSPDLLFPFMFGHEDWPRLVFVNGRLSSELSRWKNLDAGITFESFDEILKRDGDFKALLEFLPESSDEAFRLLNTAFLKEGGVFRVAKNADITHPVHILHIAVSDITEPRMMHPRYIFLSERQSRATVLESFVNIGEGSYWHNAVMDIQLAEGARLDYLSILKEGAEGFHTGQVRSQLGRNSRLDAWSLTLSGKIIRRDLKVNLQEEGAECNLYGFYWVSGDSHTDHHLDIQHPMPHGTSRQLFKGILDNRASAVFSGRVYVHPQAQKTSAEQVNKNLILSEQAKVDTQPQLEIYADDVKCSHGAAVGQLDEISLFYFKSRGIGEEKARRLLCYGFASEVIQTIPLLPVRKELDQRLLENVEKSPSLGD